VLKGSKSNRVGATGPGGGKPGKKGEQLMIDPFAHDVVQGEEKIEGGQMEETFLERRKGHLGV